ncbi:DNA-binding MarR family transcriptional regulator [Actinoplanes lutulentus]|uniref:DNA-binding MarR family transcriptional regulator n=1 Tax=Actinoplanes lutulentus TaxID=1287878 RepID=A0A327YZP1_9ACTN|nr:MarR family transcriptional regulator [Actinoplanes lutulentus]MBB2946451.1 DNA-binding MarR family transcriptional regulator [Actinoplanes lutulentus]RAK25427.1 DNA-binding MarR family transcriptional regulator [Actinoplanes lutulentus]
MTTDEPIWLTPDEMRAWRALHAAVVVLPAALDVQLQRDAGFSHLEYLALAGLYEHPDHTLRLSDLAALIGIELSRVSHMVARLEKRGLVLRRPDPDDARCTNAVLTEQGQHQVTSAAPGHVATVRKLVFDGLDATALHELQKAADRIVAALSMTDLPLAPTIRKSLRPTE